MRRIPTLVLTLAMALPVAAHSQGKPAQLPADSMAIGRKYAGWMLTGSVDSLIAHMDSASRSRPTARTDLENNLLQFASRVGVEQKLVEEKYITRNGARQFWHIAQFSAFTAEPVAVRLVISSRGEIMGFGMNPLSQTPPIDP